jgi:hypothetical protein
MALLNPAMRDKRKVKGSNPAVFMTDQTFEGDKLGGNGGGTTTKREAEKTKDYGVGL